GRNDTCQLDALLHGGTHCERSLDYDSSGYWSNGGSLTACAWKSFGRHAEIVPQALFGGDLRSEIERPWLLFTEGNRFLLRFGRLFGRSRVGSDLHESHIEGFVQILAVYQNPK